jgi:hypothetical protein
MKWRHIVIRKNYEIVSDISRASHWLSYEDHESCIKDSIIPNKLYKLIKQKDEIGQEEYFIQDEMGYLSMGYICHKGDYINIKREN